MTVTESDICKIQARIGPLLGEKAWGVSLGIGSFITLEFGTPRPFEKFPERMRGEWSLWVTYSVWRLEKEAKVIIGSEDSRSELKKAVQYLEDLVLHSVVLTPPAFDTTFIFNEGVVLRLFSICTKEFEQWMLYTPDGNVLSIGPGSSWFYTSASEPPEPT